MSGTMARRTTMSKTAIERQDYAWFALADAEHCRLLSCHLTRRGTPHVDEHDVLENTFPEHEHLRPQTGDGMTHDVEEKERRFAGEIVSWLQGRAKEREIDQLAVFATPRVLGLLRKASSGLLKGHLEEVEGNLMRLRTGQLADHPMVCKLVRRIQPTGQ
jgi:protein required for attachment to host cells